MATSPLFVSPVDSLEFLKRAGGGMLADSFFNSDPKETARRDQFGRLFRETIAKLGEDQVSDFLQFAEGKLGPLAAKQKKAVMAAMNPLRKGINQLVTLNEEYDDVPIRFARMEELVPGIPSGVITLILNLAHPDAYAIWSPRAEEALRALNLWVIEEKGEPKGRIYYDLNSRLRAVLKSLNEGLATERHPLDYWSLDQFWIVLKKERDAGTLDSKISDFRSGRTTETKSYISRWSI